MGTSLMAAFVLAAQAQATTAPCTEDIYRAFDFWAGAWDVFDTAGNKAGANVITVEEYGCLLVERWTNAAGQTGQSYNFVDLASRKWRQVWVSAGATIDYAGGLNAEGAMVLEGTIGYPAGTVAPFRGTWTPLENGDVRQHFQQYDPEKKVWNDWFVGIYRRRAE